MKTTAIFNIKGGVGKTITVINMAAELASRGKRVVCVDADPQCNLSDFFGADEDDGFTLVDVLAGGPERYLPGLIRKTQIEGVSLIAGSMRLFLADIRAMRGTSALGAMSGLAEMLAEDDYCDFMLIDCPPSFTAATSAALAAADDVVIPIRLDAFSLAGVRRLMLQLRGMREINPRICVSGVLVTQYDGTTVNKETADALRESAVPVFGTVIRRTTAVDRSTFARKALRDCRGTYARYAAEEYADMVSEYLGGGAKNGF